VEKPMLAYNEPHQRVSIETVAPSGGEQGYDQD
jgi:hypothetical protein